MIPVPDSLKINSQQLCQKILQIPGLSKTSFDQHELNQLLALPKGSDFQSSCLNILERLIEYKSSWPFLKPVKQEEVPDYYDVIKRPMDFQRMRDKIIKGEYQNRESYIADVMLICANAKMYNIKSTIYYKCAAELEKYSREILVNLKNEYRNDAENEVEYLEVAVRQKESLGARGGKSKRVKTK